MAQRLPDWAALFAQVHDTPEGSEHLVVIIRYLTWVGDEAAHEAARQVLDSVLDTQRTEALMRSYGEELIERGRRRGLEQGLAQGLAQGREQERLRGLAEAVLRILAARGVHVGDEPRQRILTCTDLATLDRWFDKSLNATALSDVLDDPAS